MRLIFLPLLAVSFFSCQKSTDSTTSKTTATDSASLLIVSSREETTSTFRTCLTAYSPRGVTKWRREDIGTQTPTDPVFENGTLFLSNAFYSSAPNATRTRLYAINAQTGSNVWMVEKTGVSYSEWLVRDNVLYVSEQENQGNYIRAYQANNGQLMWQHTTPAWAGMMTLKDNILYYFHFPGFNNGVVTAFDITSRQIKWTMSVGPVISQTAVGLSVDDNHLYFRNAASELTAYDRQTGLVKWRLSNAATVPTLIDNKLFVSFGDRLSALTNLGGTQWNWNASMLFLPSGIPSFNNSLYIQGFYATGGNFYNTLRKMKTSDGSLEWEEPLKVPIFFTNLLPVDDKIFALREENGSPGQNWSRIIVMNTSNGKAVDSIPLSDRDYGMIKVLTQKGKFY